MLNFAPWAALAMVASAKAHLLQQRAHNDTMQCCPCPTGGFPLGHNRTTVTVTVLPPRETVTIDHTVTEHETTIYVSQTSLPAPPSVVTQVVTVQPELPRKFITIVDRPSTNPASPSAPQPAETVTTTVQPGGVTLEGPGTVTITASPSHSTTPLITEAGSLPKTFERPQIVTITVNAQQPAAGPSQPDSSHDAVSRTLSPGSQPKEMHTITVGAEPSIKTVTFVDSDSSAETNRAPQATVTAPPQNGTVVIDHFTTLTQTASASDGDNINIIIININTGETICKKKNSGEPCDTDANTKETKPSTTPCLSAGVSTKTATAFNTVVMTISPQKWLNGTAPTGVTPQPDRSGSPVGRKGRIPLLRKRL